MGRGPEVQPVYHGPEAKLCGVLIGACAPGWLRWQKLTTEALKWKGEQGSPHHGIGRWWGRHGSGWR
jgi:hypothetical protein